MYIGQLTAPLAKFWSLAVSGAQFGDEAKGKFVDLIASCGAEVAARGTGGGNAGHTVVAGEEKLTLHLVPSGILHDGDGVTTICGSGMAIDPFALIQELEQLETLGITHDNFLLSKDALLVLPQHFVLDHGRELRAGKNKIGTTGRGIGPVYTDKVARLGLTVNDLLNRDLLLKKLAQNLREKNELFAAWEKSGLFELLEKLGFNNLYSPGKGFSALLIANLYAEYGKTLSPYIADTDQLLRESVGRRRILLEGAQAIHLGINTGTYPFVTSSDSSVHGLAQGVGLRERDVDLTILVAKVPMTRVGAGPFPTEFGGELSAEHCGNPSMTQELEAEQFPNPDVNNPNQFQQGVAIRQLGGEYGATTGRPRRTGWLDLVLLRDAIRKSRPCVLALTKLDVLDACRKVKVCVGYHYDGPTIQIGQKVLRSGDHLTEAVLEPTVLQRCEPHYEEFDGWNQPIGGLKDAEELPDQLKALVRFIEEFTETKVALVSVGPDRDQTIAMP